MAIANPFPELSEYIAYNIDIPGLPVANVSKDIVTAERWNELWNSVLDRQDYLMGFMHTAIRDIEQLKTDVDGLVTGTIESIPDYSIDDAKLSNNPAAIMARVADHIAAEAPHSGHPTDAEASALVTDHNAVTNAHSATAAATANRIMLRDASGRAKVAAPSATDDIARKDTVDNHINDPNPHSTKFANYLPLAGGTLTGRVARSTEDTAYTTKQYRNITLSTSNPSGGSNGDIWIKYS